MGSDEANAKCRCAYLEELFTKQSTATKASVDMIPQLPTNYDLGIYANPMERSTGRCRSQSAPARASVEYARKTCSAW
jgi:hypothetical protein